MKTINWKNTDLPYDNYQFCNLIDIPDELLEKIIADNRECLTWNDGAQITHEELSSFMIVKKKNIYSLTMRDGDFYINDIIFKNN